MDPKAVPEHHGARKRWAFATRSGSHRGRDEAAHLRAGLESALRAGHGAGVRFDLEFEGGPDGRLCLSTERGASELWVERVLLPVYEPGEWQQVPVDRPPPIGALWSGRRSTLPSERGVPAPDAGRLAEALTAACRGAARTTAVAIRLRPAPRPLLGLFDRLWPMGAAPVARGREGRPLPTPGYPGSHEAARAAAAPCWSATIDLTLELGASLRDGEVAAGSVCSAWTVLDGTPLKLRPTVRRDGEGPSSWLSEADLLGLFPARELAGGGADGGPPTVADRIPLGRNLSGVAIGLAVEPGQGRHFAVLGETGMGKSSLLVTVALRASRLGGVIVLDPLGETAESVRDELLEAGRPVLWVAPGAPGTELNALAGIGSDLSTDPVRAERGVEGLVHALRRVRAGRYADSSYWGPRLEEMVARAIRSAAALPGGTLEDAHALLSTAGSGRSVVPPVARAEFRELEGRVRDRPEDAEGARRLLYEVVRNPTLARMLCSREPLLSLSQMVAPGRAVVVSGSAGQVGESTARYLLGVYLALLWSELLSRTPPSKTFVLLDEAQWFAHEGLAEMLRLARRRNVHVGIATQSLASLPEAVRDAVLTNVADSVVFRGSPEEARDLARLHPCLSAGGLLGLARGEAVVLLGKGETIRWVRTARLPLRDDARPGTTPHAENARAGHGLLESLRARAAALAPGELLEVDLGELRAGRQATEPELRALGSALGRRHAIVRSERRAGGPVWWVDPSELSQAHAERGSGASRATAGSP